MQVAIDGPAGAGKSTIAKKLAKELGYVYLDTGAMYRGITYLVLKSRTDLNDEKAILKLAEDSVFDFLDDKIYLNGEDVSRAIRSEPVTHNVSLVSSYAPVRQVLVGKQRQIAGKKDVVMDGRDIGSVVLPEAEVKIYLNASPLCRARRRALEYGITDETEIGRLKDEIERRDYLDSHREVSPLVKAEGAVEVMTDTMGIDEVTNTLKEIIDRVIDSVIQSG